MLLVIDALPPAPEDWGDDDDDDDDGGGGDGVSESSKASTKASTPRLRAWPAEDPRGRTDVTTLSKSTPSAAPQVVSSWHRSEMPTATLIAEVPAVMAVSMLPPKGEDDRECGAPTMTWLTKLDSKRAILLPRTAMSVQVAIFHSWPIHTTVGKGREGGGGRESNKRDQEYAYRNRIDPWQPSPSIRMSSVHLGNCC